MPVLLVIYDLLLAGYNCTLADIGISREILIKAFLRTKQYAYT